MTGDNATLSARGSLSGRPRPGLPSRVGPSAPASNRSRTVPWETLELRLSAILESGPGKFHPAQPCAPPGRGLYLRHHFPKGNCMVVECPAASRRSLTTSPKRKPARWSTPRPATRPAWPSARTLSGEGTDIAGDFSCLAPPFPRERCNCLCIQSLNKSSTSRIP